MGILDLLKPSRMRPPLPASNDQIVVVGSRDDHEEMRRLQEAHALHPGKTIVLDRRGLDPQIPDLLGDGFMKPSMLEMGVAAISRSPGTEMPNPVPSENPDDWRVDPTTLPRLLPTPAQREKARKKRKDAAKARRAGRR